MSRLKGRIVRKKNFAQDKIVIRKNQNQFKILEENEEIKNKYKYKQHHYRYKI